MKDNSLSLERKKLQEQGECPSWFSSGGWQMFKQRYLYEAATPKEQYQRIASTLAKHIDVYPEWWEQHYSGKTWNDVFFDILWGGHLSPSTPILSNCGTNRGLIVSCAANYIEDNVYSFYDKLKENAILTQEGFGTATYLGNIRSRGSKISRGGKASGVLPVLKSYVQMSRDISQGSNRRGAWAGYIEITHGDFDEVCDFLIEMPDDVNIGWIITDAFRDKMLIDKDKEYIRRWGKMLKTKLTTGKGYLLYIDKVNRKVPQMYKDRGMKVTCSQLCIEIALFNDAMHTFTCVLSSPNAANFRTWPEKLCFISTVFLDCVVSEFLIKAKSVKGLEEAVRFTEKSRALGLGIMGLSTLFQKERVAFGSLESMYLQNEVMTKYQEESDDASKWLATVLGEPLWCKGYGYRNTHRRAIAPTKSTALIMGGVSEGINIDPAATFTQTTAAGELDRISPVLLEVMKERGVYNKATVQDIVENLGSVQHVTWLDEHEKLVFRNAFETDQKAILRLAAQRQRKIDQMQSLNLWFDGSEDEGYIGEVMLEALLDEDIHSVYYAYSRRGVSASKGECLACQ